MSFLLVPLGYVATPDLAEDQTALILVELQSETQLKELASLVQTIYLRLDDPQDGIHILLPADSRLQDALRRSGFGFEVLDSDMRGESFYQLYGAPEALHQAEIYSEFLISEGRLAVVRATPNQAERLERLDIKIQMLLPHPLIAPIETSLEGEKDSLLPSDITPNPLVQGMVSQVTSDTLFNYVGDLSGEWPVMIGGEPYTILTRYTYTDTPIKKATRFAYEHFQSLEIPVVYHYYSAGGYELRNVIAEQTGLTQPQRIFMVIAHLDSTSESRTTYAPGADDNASGSAAVMTIADILSQHSFGCTLRYALFTGEEQGYFGSGAYVQHVYQLHENIEGVLNLDMIGCL